MQKHRAFTFVAMLASAAACSSPTLLDEQPAPERVGQTASALVDVTGFGSNPAQLKMYKFVPSNMPAGPRPLVVALHGCTQNAATYEAAGWSTLAEQWKFYVVYPEQNTARNNSSGCFNWGGRWKSAPSAFVLQPEALQLDEIQRGHGENESIKEMVDKMKADHAVDPKRVFVTGLSAGGGMTALLLATWPDVFSGGAIFAGIPYGCATINKTTTEASNCLKDYSGQNAYLSRAPDAWASLVRAAAPDYKGPYPRVSIWQGTSDFVVNFKNSAELMKQWTAVNGVDQTPDVSDTVDGFPHKAYKDASGVTRVETYEITGQSHGTEVATSKPIDPAQPNGATCGKAGAYILNAGICSTYYAAKFFGLDPASPDPSAPPGSPTSQGTGTPAAPSGGGPSAKAPNAPATVGGAPSSCAARPGPTETDALALVAAASLLALGWRRKRSR